jgi:F-type H+-transporting ATPase subunit a
LYKYIVRLIEIYIFAPILKTINQANNMMLNRTLFTIFISIFFIANSFASESGERTMKESINHHLLDDHDFTITHGFSFPLPVILWDNGLQVFMSSKFKHGTSVAEVNGNFYKVDHTNGQINKTDSEGTFINRVRLDFSITKNVVFIMICFILMIFMFIRMARSYKYDHLPKGFGRLLEPIILYVRDDIAIPNIGKKHYKRYMSFLLTVFFFIWIINLFGLTPLGVNVTNNISVTFSLALLTYLITTFTANKSYWGHIFWMPGVSVPMKIMLAPIELLGTIIKPFSLMIRLYANIIAGHVVLMSILGLIFIFQNWIGGTLSFGLAFALSLLELLVAALQAYIFTMLSALYFGAAVEEH